MALNRYFRHTHPIFGPGFDEFFAPTPFFRDPFEAMPIFDHQWLSLDDDTSRLVRASPGYEIHERDGVYQITVELPGVKAADMTVQVEEDGRLLHISGGRKIEKEHGVTETKFDKKFTIGDNVETEKMTANLADGILVLKAPKKAIQEPAKITVPITEGPHKEMLKDA